MHFIYNKIYKLKYFLIILILRFISPDFLEKISQRAAFLIAHTVIRKVPAYKDFLRKNGFPMKKIMLSINDFKKLPIMDKYNYFAKYGVSRTLASKSASESCGWEQSSNYDPATGFMLWPRFPKDEKRCVNNLDFTLRYFFKCHEKKTLIVVSFVLGMWAAGERISRFAKRISEEGKLKITVASPGASKKDILELIRKTNQYYDQIILVGNPYFLRRVIEQGMAENVNWKNLDVKLMTGAEGFSEEWREFVLEKIAHEKELNSLITGRITSSFGTTETSGSFGTETPLTNLIRRLSQKDVQLKKKFFGDTDSLPMVFQYKPFENFLETKNGELIITRMSGQPLLRFNTHDTGRVLSLSQALKILKKSGYDVTKLLEADGYGKKDILPLPLFFVYGRNKNMLKVQGIAISIERLQQFLAHSNLIKSNTGNFKAAVVQDENGTERLKLTVELMGDIKPSLELRQKYKDVFCSTNKGIEVFLKYYDGNLKEIEPIIDLIEKGKAPFSDNEKPKHHYLKKD